MFGCVNLLPLRKRTKPILNVSIVDRRETVSVSEDHPVAVCAPSILLENRKLSLATQVRSNVPHSIDCSENVLDICVSIRIKSLFGRFSEKFSFLGQSCTLLNFALPKCLWLTFDFSTEKSSSLGKTQI